MTGPLARRVSASDWVNCEMPILPFGDALVQTSPALGFGLLSVVQQALILKNWLPSQRGLAALADALDEYAEIIWYEAALSALIN